jgi:hypothetical protein
VEVLGQRSFVVDWLEREGFLLGDPTLGLWVERVGTFWGLGPWETIPREDKGQVAQLQVVEGRPEAHLASGPLEEAHFEEGSGDHEL